MSNRRTTLASLVLVVRDAAASWLRRALETGRKGAAIKSKYLTYRQLCQVKHAHPDVERFFVIEEDEDRGDDVFFRSENISVAPGTELRGIAFDHVSNTAKGDEIELAPAHGGSWVPAMLYITQLLGR